MRCGPLRSSEAVEVKRRTIIAVFLAAVVVCVAALAWRGAHHKPEVREATTTGVATFSGHIEDVRDERPSDGNLTVRVAGRDVMVEAGRFVTG